MKLPIAWSKILPSWGALLLLLCTPLALWLPPSVGWENGPLENLQVVMLLAGAGAAWHASRHVAQDPAWRRFWLAAVPLWLLCVGRELSWGRVFYPVGVDDNGPVFIASGHLPYDALIKPTVLSIAVLSLLILLWQRPWRLLARVRLPYADIAVFLLAALVATLADKGYCPALLRHEEAVEEWAELVAYMAMFSAQWVLAWQSRRVLQPQRAAPDRARQHALLAAHPETKRLSDRLTD